MNINNLFDRAYINIPETYDIANLLFQNLDLRTLIFDVARVNPLGDGNSQLYDTNTHEFYEKRTKIYIVRKTKEYIIGMPQQFSEEDMATFVSLRQLRNLIKAFEKNKKRISCYGLIYLYVIYTLLEGKSPKANECLSYLNALGTIIHNYLENNREDPLAQFAYGCYKPIYEAIKEKNISLQNTQLPAVPRNHLQEDE